MTGINERVDALLQRLDAELPAVVRRDQRYRGEQRLRFAADEVSGDLKFFGVNVCRLAVDAVAERMRVKRVAATVNGRDVSGRAHEVWLHSNLDQLLSSVIVDALALGAAYLIPWVDGGGVPTITAEPATNMTVRRDPVNRRVLEAVKRWQVLDVSGAVAEEHTIHYGPETITHYRRAGAGEWERLAVLDHQLGQPPVVPVINLDRIGDDRGYSVIDDLGHLVDALSKILADMLVASEDVARPRRWATGVDLEESATPGGDDDGFIADAPAPAADPAPAAVSPFESGNRMFTVESPEARFGQLPGADLAGYKTAVDLLTQQIMSVSALPAHMMGITSANPASADGMRAAEASITARAEARIRVLGIPIEHAVRLALAIDYGVSPDKVAVNLVWGSPATKSAAQEADAVTKLHSLGIITTEEAREIIGVDGLR